MYIRYVGAVCVAPSTCLLQLRGSRPHQEMLKNHGFIVWESCSLEVGFGEHPYVFGACVQSSSPVRRLGCGGSSYLASSEAKT